MTCYECTRWRIWSKKSRKIRGLSHFPTRYFHHTTDWVAFPAVSYYHTLYETHRSGTYYYKYININAIWFPSNLLCTYFRVSSNMKGKWKWVTFIHPWNPQHGNVNSVLWYLVPFTLVVWWCWDQECVHRPMSVFNRLRGIRDFPTRNPAVLHSIACKISTW